MIETAEIRWTAPACILAAFTLTSCGAPGDFEGGTRYVYQVDLSETPPSEEAAAVTAVREVVERRLEAFGVRKRRVRIEGKDRLVIEVPGDSRFAQIQGPATRTGSFAFHLVAEEGEHPADLARLEEEERTYRQARRESIRRLRDQSGDPEPPVPIPPEIIVRPRAKSAGDPEKVALLNLETARVGGRHFARGSRTVDETGRPAIAFTLDPEGAIQFGELTGKNVGRTLAIVLDDEVIQIASIQSKITNNGMITGKFTLEEVNATINILRGGSLPAPLALVEEKALPGGSP